MPLDQKCRVEFMYFLRKLFGFLAAATIVTLCVGWRVFMYRQGLDKTEMWRQYWPHAVIGCVVSIALALLWGYFDALGFLRQSKKR